MSINFALALSLLNMTTMRAGRVVLAAGIGNARLAPMLGMRADLGKTAVAGMIFLIHGRAATYQVGWTSDTGRDLHAHNLMLWRAIEELRERGVRSLDLGGVNTQRSASLARFKMGLGGQVCQFAGTYLL